MKIGSKYYPLFEHLRQCAKARVSLSFAAIEKIVDAKLPTSAYKRSWWGNRDSASALQAKAWIMAGYHVEEIDIDGQLITFGQFKAGYNVQRRDDAILWDREAIRALRKHMSLTQAKFAQELGVRRQTVSEWENGVYEPDRSTAKHLERIAQQKAFEA